MTTTAAPAWENRPMDPAEAAFDPKPQWGLVDFMARAWNQRVSDDNVR